MLPDRVSNPGPLTYESGAQPIALRGPAMKAFGTAFYAIMPILRSDFTSRLVHRFAFGTPNIFIAPYNKINHGLVNLSCNCDVKSGLSVYTTSLIIHDFLV